MGADAAARLGEWREASELGGLARFAVVSQRDDVSLDPGVTFPASLKSLMRARYCR